LADFADERPNDRIGLVVYASEAYTKQITSDKAVVLEAIKSINMTMFYKMEQV
jgi:Ca-activated chloride channel family protein